METSHVHTSLVNSALFESLAVVTIPGVQRFSAVEKFKVGTQDGVKIGWIGDTFTQYFLLGAGKIEIDVPDQTLRVHRLRTDSLDAPIIEELGAEALIETTLSAMWSEMMKQGAGQEVGGELLTNRYANIFYIRSAAGTFLAVRCDWYSGHGYWRVEAYPVTDPLGWNADCQVFSR